MRSLAISYCVSLFCLLVMLPCAWVEARVWTSKNGQFSLEAEAIAFSDKLVVLKKPTGELVAIELDQLSSEDQKFVETKEVVDATQRRFDEMQTWTGKGGMKIRGKVLAFGKRNLTVQRKLGTVHIDGKKFSALDGLHKKLLLKIISHLENKTFEDDRQLETWAKSLGANPKVYALEGVLLQLESGDEIGVPFFLFSEEDLAVLQPGWELWLERDDSEKAREQESFLMKSAAMAYQRDRAQMQQIEMVKLELLAAATGAIDLWEVGLVPRAGAFARPTTVIVPAANSDIATAMALQRYPAFEFGGIRRVNR